MCLSQPHVELDPCDVWGGRRCRQGLIHVCVFRWARLIHMQPLHEVSVMHYVQQLLLWSKLSAWRENGTRIAAAYLIWCGTWNGTCVTLLHRINCSLTAEFHTMQEKNIKNEGCQPLKVNCFIGFWKKKKKSFTFRSLKYKVAVTLIIKYLRMSLLGRFGEISHILFLSLWIKLSFWKVK